MKYILKDKIPIECDDVIKWAQWLEKADRQVCQTEKNGISISTVFLGIDHSFDNGVPMLFETMIFGGKLDQKQWQYSTWEEAEKGHTEAYKLVFGSEDQP